MYIVCMHVQCCKTEAHTLHAHSLLLLLLLLHNQEHVMIWHISKQNAAESKVTG